VRCAESLRVQAYFDSELDAVSAADIERHLEHCTECRELLGDLKQVRSTLRNHAPFALAPQALRDRLANALDREALEQESSEQESPEQSLPERESLQPSLGRDPKVGTRFGRPKALAGGRRQFWAGAASGIFGSAMAAAVAFFLLAPAATSPMLDELVSAHVRSLMPDHLIDVTSTDRHTVKPWFAGHADVSPVVADFEPQGYRLLGGRADYFERQRAAVSVYRHGAHTINVFSWAANGAALPRDATRNGYHLAFWKAGNLDYCAVSDTGWDELRGLVTLLRDLDARENRG
jgi:anti-sigma factor RsiW